MMGRDYYAEKAAVVCQCSTGERMKVELSRSRSEVKHHVRYTCQVTWLHHAQILSTESRNILSAG
jgi:hypothetical protein